MKIAIISPNTKHLGDMAAVLKPQGHQILLAEGGKTRMRELADSEDPDMMLVDGMCCDPNELSLVEQVTTHHPAMAVVLLCASQTPEFLINSMRAGVREVLPSPPTAAALQAAVGRIANKLAGSRGSPSGKVVAFVSSKGGSGATFLATNLAFQLAESRSVLLLDLNLQFGDAVSFLHDGKPATTLADVARDISRLDASLLAASTVKPAPNLSVLAAPEDLAQAMEIKPEHVGALIELASAHYDFVLMDLARSLDAITIKALDRANKVHVVMQSGLPHVRNTVRMLQAFKSLGYRDDKTEVIVNRYDKSASIALDQIRKSLGKTSVITVPNSWREVTAAINHGEALARSARSNPVTRQLAELASSLNPRLDEGRSFIDRFFRRA